MGSGDWFKTIISLRKSKGGRSKKAKGSLATEKLSALKTDNYTGKESSGLANGIKSENLESDEVLVETIAATRIQTAFRAYKARKSLHRLKGFTKLKNLTEDRIKQKKLHSQLKLEAKLHDLEVAFMAFQCANLWNGVVVLRPWRKSSQGYIIEKKQLSRGKEPWHMPSHISGGPNSSQSQGLGNYELNKTGWGWSWKERWIAARPWESRVPSITISPKKAQNMQSGKVQKDKNPINTKRISFS
ncbi:IQ motif, EF-hand binding site [Sesbania bispinosa]|nr:IQ motif, EF-hand binding site [Sesbania bispinosa]